MRNPANNRDLRRQTTQTNWVIVVKRDGVDKYISKDNGFTVVLDKARRFREHYMAEEYVLPRGCYFVRIARLNISMSIE